jgi:hypothetical protein
MRGRLAEAAKLLGLLEVNGYVEAWASPTLNVWAVPSADV